eukprot:Hpha_TRINITY_DN20302_c0_g1::TRINITY_DN20302_c0_g1_i2::g.138072::m.138072
MAFADRALADLVEPVGDSLIEESLKLVPDADGAKHHRSLVQSWRAFARLKDQCGERERRLEPSEGNLVYGRMKRRVQCRMPQSELSTRQLKETRIPKALEPFSPKRTASSIRRIVGPPSVAVRAAKSRPSTAGAVSDAASRPVTSMSRGVSRPTSAASSRPQPHMRPVSAATHRSAKSARTYTTATSLGPTNADTASTAAGSSRPGGARRAQCAEELWSSRPGGARRAQCAEELWS